MAQRGMRFGLVSVILFWYSIVAAQTTAGLSTTIVFPVSAQTVSFGNEITLFNPGPNPLTASVSFYEANNSSAPGPKVCNDVVVSANRSVQLTLATQCALGTGGHFGLVVVADKAVPQSNAFYGYMRVQTPQGQGFSVEGFPITNFNNQVSHSVGLKRQAAAPTFQTNCFVASLNQPVSYELRLFNDTTGAQIGGTLSGSLQPFQQFRYLDVFGANGVTAPAGDQLNVRAQFTPTSGGSANLIGFCTVQDNASLGADFRIAKSFGSPSGSFFVQGGNAFGASAKIGTLDNQRLNIVVNGQFVMRYQPDATSPNIIGGHPDNTISSAGSGQTIGGGGFAGTNCGLLSNRFCGNITSGSLATISGGSGNAADTGGAIGGGQDNTTAAFASLAGGQFNNASGIFSSMGGGWQNTASAQGATVGGGEANKASGRDATVPGGFNNSAAGEQSVAMGGNAVAAHAQTFVWNGWSTGGNAGSFRPNYAQFLANHGLAVDYGARRDDGSGGGTLWVCICDVFAGAIIATNTGAFLSTGGAWTNSSDRARKTDIEPVDSQVILDKVIQLPVATWHYTAEDATVRHIGPMAQDFATAFGLGADNTHIATIDAEGVALVAIQGLHHLLQEKDAKIDAQGREIYAQTRELENLRDRLSRIEELLLSQHTAAR